MQRLLLSLRHLPARTSAAACPASPLLRPRPVRREGDSWPLRLLRVGRGRRRRRNSRVAATLTAGGALAATAAVLPGSVATAWADPASASGNLTVDVVFPSRATFPQLNFQSGNPVNNQQPSTNRNGSGRLDSVGVINESIPEFRTLQLSLGESAVSSGPGDGFAEIIAAGQTRDVTLTNTGGREVVFTFSGTYNGKLKAEAGASERAEAAATFSILRDGTAMFTVPSPTQPPLRVGPNGEMTIDGAFTTGDIRLAAGASSIFRLVGNLRVTAATVPEPSACAFAAVFGLGGLALVARGRRRKRLLAAEPGV